MPELENFNEDSNIYETFQIYELSFIGEFQALPFNIVYAMDIVDDKVDLFNILFTYCLEQHAPLSKMKVSRPPTPWLKDLEICNLKQTRNEFRYNAYQTQSEDDWRKYRDVRNKLKKKIRTTKNNFYKNALNSNRSKEVWKIIHRILNRNQKNIVADPNTLNNHFVGNTKRLT